MALTQEQINVDNGFKDVAADIKSITAQIAVHTATLAQKADLLNGKLKDEQTNDLSVSDFLGEVATESAMLALVGQKGDWAVRTDVGKVFLIVGNPQTLAGWRPLTYPVAPLPDNYSYVNSYRAAKA